MKAVSMKEFTNEERELGQDELAELLGGEWLGEVKALAEDAERGG